MEPVKTDLDAFGISEEFGFVVQEPLTNLPDYYQTWEDLANNLSHLIESRKLRDMVHEMPVLTPHLLTNQKELIQAHVVLGFISMGYVWQEGEHAPVQVLPKALALPFWLVSRRLGLPPILTYADSVLANWKLKDPTGNMDMENLELLYSLPGGESYRGFLIVSLLVEIAAGPGIMGAQKVKQAMETSNFSGVENGLNKVTQALKKMKELFQLMHNHVDASVFYGTLRIFFFGWRDNPVLPRGLLYEGVSETPFSLSGISASQSSSLQCFDALLGIEHEDEAGAFLKRMRDYMPPSHSQLIERLSHPPSLRGFIFSSCSSDLRKAYNDCVSALVDLRSYHLNVVAKYIIVPKHKVKALACPLSGGRSPKVGSGGTNGVGFLKHVRDTSKKVLI